MPRLFPMFLKLEDRRVLVVGAGSMAEPKIADLLDTGARIKVIAFEANESIAKWARAGLIELEERGFVADDLAGIDLVVVATFLPALNQLVFSHAQRQGVLCNVVDVPEQCDFFYPAIVKRGDLQIAISTAGQSPSLAQRLRQQLERQFGLTYAKWVAELGETRREILKSKLAPEQKQELLKSLASRGAFDAMVARGETLRRVGQEVA
ncbi:MAG TPA: bifunctional precorrin-2 dehydrogenase/sirohydrochlorin ferrochelatase [Terriglobales bacterium]|nr:bifunctional precorrin-2 dehydrogenase/sirohydrochlorin ferrochelatase [Terriglobales bacterium]